MIITKNILYMPSKKRKKPNTLFIKRTKGDFTTVKTSLKSILKDYPNNFETINNLVLECNEIVSTTYQFIRLFILHKFHKGEQIPTLDVKTILYFLRACGTRDNRGVKPQNKHLEDELLTFYEREFSPLLKGKPQHSLKNKTNINK